MIREGKTPEEALYIVESKVFKHGIVGVKLVAVAGRSFAAASQASVSTAGGAVVSGGTYAFAGLVLAA